MPDQPKHPLKLVNLAEFSQETQFISKNEFVLGWHTRGSLLEFQFSGCGGPHDPFRCVMSKIS